MRRIIWIVMDSVGMGALPDASSFGDAGADTIGHIMDRYPDLKLPNLRTLGYGNIDGIHGVPEADDPIGYYGRVMESSNGKDTTIGHWEMTGIETTEPFPVYPNGFPKDVIDEFIKQTGVKGILGNYPASGTEIIKELGKEHEQTGYPIIYTSADSVFQIAAMESVIPVERLYDYCKIARKILVGKNNVARVIARPFIKTESGYQRTANRRDFSRKPSKDNLLVYLTKKNIPVYAVGKISDIFAGEGITEAIHTKDNMDGVDQTLHYMDCKEKGLIFTNLVDFDAKWGHRRDIEGYARGLEAFDSRLPEVLLKMKEEDLLIICADHGCDPSFHGTDHTREYIPLLMYGKFMKTGMNLHTVKSFGSIGQTVAFYLGCKSLPIGQNLFTDMKEQGESQL